MRMVETFSFNGLNILIENGGIQRREKKNINKLKKYEEINELIIRK
jgi:chitinase